MSRVELAVAAILGTFGLRSVVYWVKRPFDSTDVRDHALYALFLAGRVGLWFALSASFLVLARDTGTRFGEEAAPGFAVLSGPERLFVVAFLALGALQFVAGYFLGRRRPRESREAEDELRPPRN